MEVFGAIAGAVNCADAGIRVCDGLARLIQQTKDAETSAKYLQDKVNSLHDMLLDLRVTLKSTQGTCLSGEANRIHTNLVKSLECCRDTLTGFEHELEGLHGRQKLEILKKLLVTTNNANAEILRRLGEEIQDGGTYLQKQSDASKAISPPSRTFTALSQATTVIQEDEDPAEFEHEKEDKGKRLKTLSDSIEIATEVYNRMSRPASIIEEAEIDNLDTVISNFDATRPREVLDLLVKTVEEHVGEAVRRGNFQAAEKHQISLIEYLEERRNAYRVAFDEYDAQESLAEIFRQQGRLQEHDEIHVRLIKPLMSLKELEDDVEQSEHQSRSYKALAASRLRQCSATGDVSLLKNASRMAKRSFEIRRQLLLKTKHVDPLFDDIVRLLVKILQRQSETVEAGVYIRLYLSEAEFLSQAEDQPPSPPLTPVKSNSTGQTSQSRPSINIDEPVNGFTPLVLAIHRQDMAHFEHLLKEGADPEMICQGMKPLRHAVYHHLPNAAELLCQKEPDLDLEERDAEGRTVLALAAEGGDNEMVDALAELGASVEAPSKDGRTPLMLAAENGHVSAVKTLISKVQDCRETDSDGWNSLHYAVHKNGGQEVIQVLIDAGISVDSRCKNGETALHIAVQLHDDDDKRQENLETLFLNNANLNLADGAGNRPVSVAIESDYVEVAQILFERGAIYDRKPPSGLHKDMAELVKKHQNLRDKARRDSSGTTVSSSWFPRRRSSRNGQR
ncbi:MAG: hypothetical protein Q9160_006812 [Pyrenula sp. 1 TL-2023]